VIALALWRHGWRACLPWVAAGILVWTWAEYIVHRFVLHGIFPDRPGWWRQLLHRRFDHLHWHHHREPWNGRHISGTLRDTGPFVAVLAALALMAPLPTAPALLAAFLLGYVIEEWVHLSVHFAGWRGRYFRYIRRHHMYHHGARGLDLAFGLTSDAWDRVYGTQVRVRADRGAAFPCPRASRRGRVGAAQLTLTSVARKRPAAASRRDFPTEEPSDSSADRGNAALSRGLSGSTSQGEWHEPCDAKESTRSGITAQENRDGS
jgi:hypothetical protein